MNEIRGGKYYSLKEIAEKAGVTRMSVVLHARKLLIEPLKFGRLYTRYHEDQVNEILNSYRSS